MRDACKSKSEPEHVDDVRREQPNPQFRVARRSGLKRLTPASEAGIFGGKVMYE